MLPRSTKKKKRLRNWAEKQYANHLRHNKHFAEFGVHDFVIILDNLKPSFNIGKIFRSADAFGARAIYLIGIDYFHTKSAKGAFKWVPAFFCSSFDECYRRLTEENYTLHILEPGADTALGKLELSKKSGFVFGHEEHGISFDRSLYPQISTMTIPQFGRVESLNVSVAASVVMYEYVRQFST